MMRSFRTKAMGPLANRASREIALILERPAADPYDVLGPDYGRLLATFAREGPTPSINLLLPELPAGAGFAGIRTAVAFGEGLANAMARPLRIVPFRQGISQQIGADQLRQSRPDSRRVPLRVLRPNSGDIWVATMWNTAAALRLACTRGHVSPGRVVYLVQDYEAAFHPWSSQYALAAATYHADFAIVTNSRPLAQFLRHSEQIEIDDALVLGPVLDLASLANAQAQRRPHKEPTIFFYARPSKPRNLFAIGAAALGLLSRDLERSELRARVITAGESHPNLSVGPHLSVEMRGRVSWDSYYDILANSDIALTLMLSPHPSHPPLDFALAGARVITNEFGSYRSSLHPSIVAVPATPEALASALLATVSSWKERPVPSELADLGNPLESVISTLVPRLLTFAG